MERAENTPAQAVPPGILQAFASFCQFIPTGICLTDEAGRFVEVNDAYCRIYGYPREELLGRHLTTIMHPDDRERGVAAYARLLAGCTDIPTEWRRRHKDGTSLWIEWLHTPCTFPDGRRLVVSTVADVTGRKQAGAALQDSEGRYRRLFQDAVLGIFQSTPDGKVLGVNPAFARMFGYESPQDVAATVHDVTTQIFADPQRRSEILQIIAERPDLHTFENLYRRKDGSTFPGTLHVRPVRDAEGRLQHVEGLIEDITARRQAEGALRTRTEQLEAVRAVSAEIIRELELGRLLELITRRAAELVGATTGTLFLWDAAAQVLTPAAWPGFEDWRATQRFHLGEGVAGTVAARRQGLIVNDYRTSPYAHPYGLQHPDLVANLGEPLLYRDELVGVIVIDKWKGEGAFAPHDRDLLALFATQAAIAIENARLYAAAERRATEWEALREVAEEITRELDLRRVLTLIARRAVDLVGADADSLWVWDDAAQILAVESWHGQGDWMVGRRLRPGEGLAGTVALRREGLLVNDYPASPYSLPVVLAHSPITASLGEPLLFRGRLLGALVLDRLEGRPPFTSADQHTVRLFSAQAAIAIENARLYVATQRELEERKRTEVTLRARTEQLEAMRAIGEELTRELSLPAVLDLIVRRAVDLLDATSGTILLWEEASQTVVPQVWVGLGEWRRDLRVRVGEGVPGLVAQRREGMLVNDYRTSAFAHPLFLEHTAITASLAEPLLYRDRLVGVVTIDRDAAGGPFTPQDADLLRLFAAQAAIAIENARLFADLNQSYQTLRQAQNQLVRSEKLRALGQLSAGVAHELNNTLAAILGRVELLKLQGTAAAVRESLEVLETAATDGAAVVRRLQDFARQQVHSALAPMHLAAIAEDALEITRPRWKEEPERRGCTIETRLDLAGLPPVLGNASEIREALMNLVLNAVDAMPAGGLLTFQGTVQGEWVELAVADTGVGIPEGVQPRIFEPFFTTKGGHGTGLGLSVVYGIMERHGGAIRVSSTPGQGTTFLLRFRSTACGSPEHPQPAAARACPRRILVVDDDPAVRTTVVALLQAAGHTVIGAESGAKALDAITGSSVDLVVTDLGMPEMTGWELARSVKARAPAIPVILLTGWGEHVAGEADGRRAVDRVVGKPVRMQELLALIAELTGPPQPTGGRRGEPDRRTAGRAPGD